MTNLPEEIWAATSELRYIIFANHSMILVGRDKHTDWKATPVEANDQHFQTRIYLSQLRCLLPIYIPHNHDFSFVNLIRCKELTLFTSFRKSPTPFDHCKIRSLVEHFYLLDWKEWDWNFKLRESRNILQIIRTRDHNVGACHGAYGGLYGNPTRIAKRFIRRY